MLVALCPVDLLNKIVEESNLNSQKISSRVLS